MTNGKDILYKDNKGKIVRVTGTPDEIAQQLVNAGVAEYKPMIFGNGKTGTGKNATVEEIVVPADAIIKSTNENKALQGANAAYEVQKRFAAEKNGKTDTSGTSKITYTNEQLIKDPNGKDIKAGVRNGKWYNVETGEEIK